MSAAHMNGGLFEFDAAMSGSLVVSVLFHVAVIVLLSMSLPFLAKDRIIVSNPISVEIVDIDELTQSNKPSPPKKADPEKMEAKPQENPSPPKMTAEAPPDLTKPKPPDVKDAVAEPREAVPPPKPLKKVELKKPPPKKPKPPAKKVAAPKQNDFASLLRNLTPDTEAAEQAAQPDQVTASQISQIARLADRLTISEMDAVKRGLMPCWNIPIGTKDAEKQIVEVRLLMNPDRTVQQATIMNQGRYTQDSYFQAAADAALRALRNPRCAPLQFPPNKYEEWKTTIIEFNPSDML